MKKMANKRKVESNPEMEMPVFALPHRMTQKFSDKS